METMTKTQAVRRLAPEDIQVGDFVTLVSETYQFPTFLWFCGDGPQDEPVRMKFLPCENVGAPLKVQAVCLPFVITRTAGKKFRTLDVRQCELARLDAAYAEVAWRGARKKKRKK